MVHPDKHLTLGHIRYLNCVPFFGALAEQGFQGRLIPGVPSELNRMLHQGHLDASPSSSFEYARNWRDYLLLPGHSVSSTGRIASVLLFSPVPPEQLEGHAIAITGESATSINLLRILLKEFYRCYDVTDYVPDATVESQLAQRKPALLIGDRALRTAQNCPEGIQIYDLGELWYQHTELPFVFALWMVRKEVLPIFTQELDQLGYQLQASCDYVLKNCDYYAAAAGETIELPIQQIIDYWRTIDYRLDEQHQRGFLLFVQLCVEYGLLNEVPELNFFN